MRHHKGRAKVDNCLPCPAGHPSSESPGYCWPSRRWSRVRSECFHGSTFLHFPTFLLIRDITGRSKRNTRETNCIARLAHLATRQRHCKWKKLRQVCSDRRWHHHLSLDVLRGCWTKFFAHYESHSVLSSMRSVSWCHTIHKMLKE